MNIYYFVFNVSLICSKIFRFFFIFIYMYIYIYNEFVIIESVNMNKKLKRLFLHKNIYLYIIIIKNKFHLKLFHVYKTIFLDRNNRNNF